MAERFKASTGISVEFIVASEQYRAKLMTMTPERSAGCTDAHPMLGASSLRRI